MSNDHKTAESLESFLATHTPKPFKPSVRWEDHTITVYWKDAPHFYEAVNQDFGLFRHAETEEVIGVEVNRRGEK